MSSGNFDNIIVFNSRSASENKAVDNVIGFKSGSGNSYNVTVFNSGSASVDKTVYKIIGFKSDDVEQDDNVILNAGSSASEKNSLDNIKPKNDGSAIAKKQGYFITLKSDRSVNADKTVDNVIGFKSGNGKQGNNATLKSDRSAIARNRVDNIKSIVGRSASNAANGRRGYIVTAKNGGTK